MNPELRSIAPHDSDTIEPKRRWSLPSPVKHGLIGAGILLTVLVLVAAVGLCYVGWTRAAHGEWAYQFIQQVQAQAAAQQKMMQQPAPAPSPTPTPAPPPK